MTTEEQKLEIGQLVFDQITQEVLPISCRYVICEENPVPGIPKTYFKYKVGSQVRFRQNLIIISNCRELRRSLCLTLKH